MLTHEEALAARVAVCEYSSGIPKLAIAARVCMHQHMHRTGWVVSGLIGIVLMQTGKPRPNYLHVCQPNVVVIEAQVRLNGTHYNAALARQRRLLFRLGAVGHAVLACTVCCSTSSSEYAGWQNCNRITLSQAFITGIAATNVCLHQLLIVCALCRERLVNSPEFTPLIALE